jgi:TRAP-type mannitol/chloroaromatic compound transport system substrate-binding protein
MDRRSFIRQAGLAGAGVAGLSTVAAPALSQNKITWRMVTTWPKGLPGLGVGAQRLADRITAASGGRLTVQVFSAGELVPPFQSIDAVIDGGAEMSHGASYFWQNKSKALAFFTGVPFGMTSRELSAWMRFLGGQEVWNEVYDQFGLQGFLSGDTGTQAGGWFRKELTGLDDVKGLRFRTPGLGGQVWGKLGASVTTTPPGEIFQALQSGTLDAAEFVGPYNDLALGFYKVCKIYYTSSFVEPGLATELVVNKSKFQALPSDLQALITDICQAEYDQVASDFAANDPRALGVLVNEHGVTAIPQFPESIVMAGAKASAEVLLEIGEQGDALTKKTLDSYLRALDITKIKTDGTDAQYVAARTKYFKL